MTLKAMAAVSTAPVFMAGCKKEKDAPAFLKQKMKKLVMVLAVAGTLLSCKKEKTEIFEAEGFWRGNIYLLHLVVVNKENGKSRIYIGSSYGDTATASQKYDGVYEVHGNSFLATYYDGDLAVASLESDKTAPGKIWGRGYILQSGLQFELTKEKD